MAVIALRHTAPCMEAGICYGAKEVDVDEAQVRACADEFARKHPSPTAMWHSPRQRCAKLAQALGIHWAQVVPSPRAELAEMDFGVWEGQAWDAIGKAAIDAWMADFARHAPGGGECMRNFLLRVRHALLASAGVPGDVLWVTHAGVIRALAWWLGGSHDVARAERIRAAEWPSFAVDFAGWQRLELPTVWAGA